MNNYMKAARTRKY